MPNSHASSFCLGTHSCAKRQNAAVDCLTYTIVVQVAINFALNNTAIEISSLDLGDALFKVIDRRICDNLCKPELSLLKVVMFDHNLFH